ncbi:Focadhesin isoform X1 [Oopsacas minuta]|uniref:Focadhesin isoform X1 n=1 Tax=Oopsacas minuta TaxID=111878 RepID=A0AAV7JM90_9METZ|nr:Focadhesin isoform X1 [Oopsacas minuta]
MASGFQYTCSQFISALQFPSLNLQVQEVAHHLKETNSNLDSTSSSSSSSSQTLKLFLSGLECEEVGAVESSCWGLRRLCETNNVTASELVALLLSRLTSCLYPLPVISLMGDLLLKSDISNNYNIHTNQHPLAVAFSSCSDAVLSTLFSLFSHSASKALYVLWPCLAQILNDPQLADHKFNIVSAMLEINSIHGIPENVSSSITRLLLLSVIYESEFSIKIQLIHSLLDFSLSQPIFIPLSEISTLCYNTLLTSTSCFLISPLLHKLKRLLLLYSHLLTDYYTIVWLSLSLLRTNLTQFSSLLADITELVLDKCNNDSVSDITRDSLSLLIFSILGAQLNLERLRPDTSSRYSLLLHTLLNTGKRVKRYVRYPDDSFKIPVPVFSESTIYHGELNVFASLSSHLLVCSKSVILKWCEYTLQALSQSEYTNSPLSICCIVSSLLVEFTSYPPDQLTEHQLIIRILIQIVSQLVRTATNFAPPLIALLLLTMDRSSHPEDVAQTLHTISTLSTHPACVIIVLRSLLSLTDTSSLLPAVLRALISLWKLHDPIYPHIQQLIQIQHLSTPEWKLATSFSVLDICSTRPAVHGEEMIPQVQSLIRSRECSLFVSIGLSALTSLVSADTIDYTDSLDLLAVAVGTQSPTLWESSVAERATQLLRLSHKLLDVSVARDQELLSRCVQQLIILLTHTNQQVRATAVSALSDFTPRDLIMIEPFALNLRRELSIPECLDLPSDRRARCQCGSLFSFILHIEYSCTEECTSLRELLSCWMREELNSISTVYPREHKQEVERGEAVIRSTSKVLTECLPKLKHMTDIPDSLNVSPYQAAALLFTGIELWVYSESPHKLMQQYLHLLSRCLSYSIDTSTSCISQINEFLVFINGIQLFMRDALSVYRPPSSPLESLFGLLDKIKSEDNPQGSMWLMVGLALNVSELYSTGIQTAIQSLVDSLLLASSHLLTSTDSHETFDEHETIYSSRNLTPLSGVSFLTLGVLGGTICAHLNQKFSTNYISSIIKIWQASRHSPQLDVMYALTIYSVINANTSYLLQEGPAARKLTEISKRCIQQIQDGMYPSQYAYLLLTDDVTLIRNKQQESMKALTCEQQLESSALTCSVLTCRLYSMCEISLQDCDEVISTFLKLSRDHPYSFPHTAVGMLLYHTACYGHVASQLLISKTLSQLRSILQQSRNDDVSSLLLGILAIFGAFQPIIGPTPPPTPAHYSVLQQGVKSFLDYASPRVDKQNKFSHMLTLLGFIHSQYSHYSDTIRTPSSSEFLSDNILLSPLFKFLEEAQQSGAISQNSQQDKFVTIFEVMSETSKPLPNYPWSNLVTSFQRNSENDSIHASLLKLLFKLQSQASEQELERITFLIHHWLLDPALDRNKITNLCRQILAENINNIFNLCKEEYLFNNLLTFLCGDKDLTVHVLIGLVKLKVEKETTVVQKHKQTLVFSALKILLKDPITDQLCCDRAIPLLAKCMSHLSPGDLDKLIPKEGELFILIRSHLFNNTLDYHWLKPCIIYLIRLPSLVSKVESNHFNLILSQISLIRALPNKCVSEVCLELFNLIRPELQMNSTSSIEDISKLMFNSMIILSLVSPEISRMSAALLTTQLHPDTFLLSEMTHFLLRICSSSYKQKIYVPILKKLYECLLLFFQLLDTKNSLTSNTSILLFSLLAHLRQIDDIVSGRPWAAMGQAIFTHSKLFLK